VPTDVVSRAARDAILGRLYVTNSQHQPSDPAYKPQALRLLSDWRDRVTALARLGWLGAKGASASYARNCPPCLVEWSGSTAKKRCCLEYAICPWCWARVNVSQTYARLQRARQALGAVGNRCEEFRYLSLNIREELPDLNEVIQYATEVGLILCNTWIAMREKCEAFGACAYVSVYPFRHRYRALYRAVGIVDADFHSTSDRVRTEPMTEQGLLTAVTRYAAYPRGRLRAPAAEVVDLLNALRGQTQWRQVYGVFRGARSEA
jgi:hypothetical protein